MKITKRQTSKRGDYLRPIKLSKGAYYKTPTGNTNYRYVVIDGLVGEVIEETEIDSRRTNRYFYYTYQLTLDFDTKGAQRMNKKLNRRITQ